MYLDGQKLIFLYQNHRYVRILIPHYTREGKTQLILGIGCTGGVHRSVAIIANKIAEILNS